MIPVLPESSRMPASETLPGWVPRFFGAMYAACDLNWPRAKQDAVADGVVGLLALCPGQSVLDQGCGTGSLALGLARRGIQVWALDQSAEYVAAGARAAAEEGLGGIAWVHGDAGVWSPPSPVAAAISWHSSLGYGGEAAGHALLRALRSNVTPGGRWLVECANPTYLKTHLADVHVEAKTVAPWGAVQVHRRSRWEGAILHQDWSVQKDGAEVWACADTACWRPTPEDLEHWANQAGDRVIGRWASAGSDPWHPDAPRTVLVVERGP